MLILTLLNKPVQLEVFIVFLITRTIFNGTFLAITVTTIWVTMSCSLNTVGEHGCNIGAMHGTFLYR